MIIYIIIKLLLSYGLVIKKEGIKDQKKVHLSFDLLIVGLYFIILYEKGFYMVKELILISIILIILVIIYKSLNYIEKNNVIIVLKIKEKIGEEKSKKIKEFFLKPIVCDIIYYMIGMLPGNMGYGIYFFIIEHSGYGRVGISSTRDIILWKLFKGDSRDFFYKLNKKIFNNKIYLKIRFILIARIKEMIYRIMYVLYYIRKVILEINIKKYVGIRLITYMYLSMFYLYILMEIQYLNRILFYLLIIGELLCLFFTKEIIEYFEKEFYHIGNKKGLLTYELISKIYFLKFPFISSSRVKGIKNKFIWDEILNNSISLNILYKYILFVNKNTKGYFDRQKNIMTRVKREKYLEKESIIGEILPRTRYVIISLKNEAFYIEKGEGLKPDFLVFKSMHINLLNNTNFYLSYYEKTYGNSSLLMLLGTLRVNKRFGTKCIDIYCNNDFYYIFKLKYYLDTNRFFDLHIYMFLITYIFTFDKRLIPGNVTLFLFFLNNDVQYFSEEYYFYQYKTILENKKNDLKISEKICSMKRYKKMFKIMGRIMLHEEDIFVGNESSIKILDEFYTLKKENKKIKEYYENKFKELLENFGPSLSSRYAYEEFSKIIKYCITLKNPELLNEEKYKEYLERGEGSDLDEEIQIEKTIFDGKDVDEVLKLIYIYQLKVHYYISSGIFTFKKGYVFYDGEIIDEELKDYKE